MKYLTSSAHRKSVILWLASGCFLIFLMVLIGGLTRLTHSGLSMVDWTLFGSTPPLSQNDWENLFERYKQYPEYQQVNFNFSLEDFKKIFWWEYIHRLLGRFIGLVFLAGFIYFNSRKYITPAFNKKLLILGLLGFLQGLMGWLMVKSGLKDIPDVSHYRLAAHLLLAFFTFAYNWGLLLDLYYEPIIEVNQTPHTTLKRAGIFFFILLTLQILYGAFVAGLDAGFVFNHWPLMDNARHQWIADAVFALEPLWRNFTEGIAGVQFIHRYLPYLLFLTYFFIIITATRQSVRLSKSQRRAITWLGILLTVQFMLGVLTLIYQTPIALASLHQVGGFGLWMSTIYYWHRFK